MNVLMTLAVIGAAIIGEWEEAAAVVVLFSLGNALESHVMRRTRRAIGALLDLAPAQAVVRRDHEEVVVAAEELVPGDVIVVRPGERIVTDGTVASGSSPVDQAPLTGESGLGKIPMGHATMRLASLKLTIRMEIPLQSS